MPAVIKNDEIGPEYFIQVSDAKAGLLAFLSIDNTNLGPGKGGIRLAQNVSGEEVWRLSRGMTWKNALAELPFGGAKSGIDVGNKNPHDAAQVNKDALIRAFARKIKYLIPEKYIAGPDMNTTEVEKQKSVHGKKQGDGRLAARTRKHRIRRREIDARGARRNENRARAGERRNRRIRKRRHFRHEIPRGGGLPRRVRERL
jgi:hypothetical protein